MNGLSEVIRQPISFVPIEYDEAIRYLRSYSSLTLKAL